MDNYEASWCRRTTRAITSRKSISPLAPTASPPLSLSAYQILHQIPSDSIISSSPSDFLPCLRHSSPEKTPTARGNPHEESSLWPGKDSVVPTREPQLATSTPFPLFYGRWIYFDSYDIIYCWFILLPFFGEFFFNYIKISVPHTHSISSTFFSSSPRNLPYVTPPPLVL